MLNINTTTMYKCLCTSMFTFILKTNLQFIITLCTTKITFGYNPVGNQSWILFFILQITLRDLEYRNGKRVKCVYVFHNSYSKILTSLRFSKCHSAFNFKKCTKFHPFSAENVEFCFLFIFLFVSGLHEFTKQANFVEQKLGFI